MSLIELVLAMSIALSGALGLNLAWSQSLLLEQQLAQARVAQTEALMLLYAWQQTPSAAPPVTTVKFYQQLQRANVHSWQMEFQGLTGPVQWHGIWARPARVKPAIGKPTIICN